MNEFIENVKECKFDLSSCLYIKTGVAGFEPTNGGVKVHSLTAWRHPRKAIQ